MKIPFFSGEEKPKPVSLSYRTEFRDFIKKNAPLDFDHKMSRARPFIFTSFIAWPMFWMYRGMDWGSRARLNRSLVTYINRTFHQAKLMQFAIIGAGLLFATYEDSPFLQTINNVFQNEDDEDIRDW